MPQLPLFALYVVSALVSVAVAGLAWQRRRATPAAPALAATMASLAWWSACWSLAHLPLPLEVQSRATEVGFVGVVGTVASAFCMCRSVADRGWRPGRRTYALLAVEPALALSAVATNDLHRLFVRQWHEGDPAELHTWLGPLFLAHTAYSYSVLAVGLVLLARSWLQAPGVQRRQVSSLLVASVVPIVGNAASLVASHDGRSADHTPLFFTVTGVVAWWALTRQGLMQLVPVARGQVVETMSDAVLVVDAQGLVLDLNPAGRAMLRTLRPHGPVDVVGLPAAEVVSPAVMAPVAGRERRELLEPRPGLHLDLRISLLLDGRGAEAGRVVVTRDVSEEHARHAELAEAHRRLREQLEVIEGLRAELAEEVERDSLTGLHNRRHLERALDAALEGGGPVAVLVVDVDHFKAVNDTHGHPAGDAVLRGLAQDLVEGARAGDTVARWGGEEFVLVLPGAAAAQAVRRGERLRRQCARRVHVLGGTPVRVTASVGVAASPGAGATAAALLDAADRALYAAKAGGRDRVVDAAALVAA
ncbi:histidine kinase N-terminal 7TM domain-containing diguanylate cyclase [Vallicoccus soli]|uniref:Diguanylate cyclase n=1 Tax=Vallicoccus soli TaxID=2339232 RepID=A0A3A3Z1C3_9ACTN|nr:histidine kinase N-terminal 7TM domain-containing protein [Vallicoccus soli]RJK98050.1 diguanylate cyclase [Vallicoccus soli]